MSAILGVFAPAGLPSHANLTGSDAHFRHRRSDSVSGPTFVSGSIAMRAFGTASEPGVLETDAGALVLAGRVDNAGDVAAEGNVAIQALAAAYGRWGTECAAHLLGDFSFAIWDRRAGTLYCARDVFGIKPFYYARRDGCFWFASEIGPLLRAAGVDRTVNEGMVAEFLACGITSATDTLFSAVSRLPPAHALTMSATGLRIWRYWTPALAIEPSNRSFAGDVERFRELLTESVRARMRGASRIGVTLSGGVDSSTIAAVAVAVARTGQPAPSVAAFSLAFPGRPCDERQHAEITAGAVGIDLHIEPASVPTPDDARRYARVFADFPGYPNTMMFDGLRRAAAGRGYTVLLTGEGGDDWFAGSYYHYADLVRARRWRDLLTQHRADRQLAREQAIALPRFALLRLGVWPLLSTGARRILRPWIERRPAPWLSRAFAARVRLAARTARSDLQAAASVAQAHQLAATASGADAHYFEIAERSAALCGVEERHPFYDRRLVEFALGLPEDRRWSGRENKRVIREAMRGVLPEAVRTRTAKAHFSFVYAELLEALNRAASARDPLGTWIEAKAMARMMATMRRFYAAGDERYTKYIWPLWMAAGIDLWLAAGPGGAGDTFRSDEHEWTARPA